MKNYGDSMNPTPEQNQNKDGVNATADSSQAERLVRHAEVLDWMHAAVVDQMIDHRKENFMDKGYTHCVCKEKFELGYDRRA
jgi:hypothetical protein